MFLRSSPGGGFPAASLVIVRIGVFMAVKIRLTRLGRTHKPYYRVVAIDSRNHREGRTCEVLGTYDPMLKEKNISVDIEAIHKWILNGAQVSDSVASLLKRAGYEVLPEEKKAAIAKKIAKRSAGRKSAAKKDGKKWVKPSRRALMKHKLGLKKDRLAKQAEELAAKKAADEAAAAASEAESAEAPAENAEG